MKSLKFLGVLAAALAVIAYFTFYIVPEGHVTVVNFTGKADRMETPGFRAKIPVLETTNTFEVRERKNVETLSAATANQLPVTAVVSLNWTVNKTAAMDLYIKYGGLEQFEERILDPRMRSAAKAAIARYPADKIIRERQKVVAEIQAEIMSVTEFLPITISNTQLEDVQLPESYMQAIMAKERAREDAAREQHNLDKQKLVAQQIVQTADAERDAVKSRADGDAYAKRVNAEAESYRILTEYTGRSEGVEMLAAQLTPKYNDYLRAQKWNGKLPVTMLGDGGSVLLGIGTAPVK